MRNGAEIPDAPATGFAVLTPRRSLHDLFLPEAVRMAAEELIEEQQRTEVLAPMALSRATACF